VSTPPRAALSTEVFEALLARLRADGEPAERAYERLRARLIALLRLHAPAEAESLADIALDRTARRIHEGVDVENVHSYALGVGRMLVLEARTRAARERRMERELAQAALSQERDAGSSSSVGDPETAQDEARLLAAISDCLGELGQEASDLMLAYYSGDGAERIARRQRMAEGLGISLNALRNRALRLRGMLERCARERLRGSEREPAQPGDESPVRDTRPGGCPSQ
jgi:hypothetical protein